LHKKIHSDIEENILTILMRDNATEHLPGMDISIILKEMVQTSVATDISLEPSVRDT
jgi:hypothetical protein